MKYVMFILAAVGFFFLSDLTHATGPLQNEGHESGVTPLDDAGKVSGEVVNLNEGEGTLEIRTSERGVTRIQMDKDHPGAMNQLKGVKPGDKVLISLTMEAVDVKKNGSGGNGPAPEGEDRGGSLEQAAATGKLSGEVVGLDRSEKSLDIRVNGGGITHIHLDEKTQGAWKNIKPGDRIEVTMTMEGTSVGPKAPG